MSTKAILIQQPAEPRPRVAASGTAYHSLGEGEESYLSTIKFEPLSRLDQGVRWRTAGRGEEEEGREGRIL